MISTEIKIASSFQVHGSDVIFEENLASLTG